MGNVWVRVVINQNRLIKEKKEIIEKIVGGSQKCREDWKSKLGDWQPQMEAEHAQP